MRDDILPLPLTSTDVLHHPVRQQHRHQDTLPKLAIRDEATSPTDAGHTVLGSSTVKRGRKRSRPHHYHDSNQQLANSLHIPSTQPSPVGDSSCTPASVTVGPANRPQSLAYHLNYDSNITAFTSNAIGVEPQLPLYTPQYSFDPLQYSNTYSTGQLPPQQQQPNQDAEPQSAISHGSSHDQFPPSTYPQDHRTDANEQSREHMSDRPFYPPFDGYSAGQAQIPDMGGGSYRGGDWLEGTWTDMGSYNGYPRYTEASVPPGFADQAVASYAHNEAPAPNTVFQDTAGLYGNDPSMHLKLASLPSLEKLASSIIQNLAKSSLDETQKLRGYGPNDEDSQAFQTQMNLFVDTRRIYLRGSIFIDPITANLVHPQQQEIAYKANRATFISTLLLEPRGASIVELNGQFLEAFVPLGTKLLKWQGAILLDLKTQLYIMALTDGHGPVDSMFEELFPDDMADILISRHPDSIHLVPSETDFLDRLKQRKQFLRNEPPENAVQVLPRRYAWQEFITAFLAYVNKNVDYLLNTAARSGVTPLVYPTTEARRTNAAAAHYQKQLAETRFDSDSAVCSQQRNFSNFGALIPNEDMPRNYVHPSSTAAAASSVAPPLPFAPSSSVSDTPSNAEATAVPPTAARKTSSEGKAAPSTYRQPWRPEEEQALLNGLEEVNGPYWSRILSMHGKGGTRTEVLKDRNQIQLKDKARNLKLYYLKMGKEVPPCLQGVTGNLRMRGGAKFRGVDGDGGGGGSGGGLAQQRRFEDEGGGESSSRG